MKRNKLLTGFLLALTMSVFIVSCTDDIEGGDGTTTFSDFATLASSYSEEDGTGTLTIPFRNGSASFAENADIVFGGTAIEGVDYEVVSISEAGVQISVIDDDSLEVNETIRLKGDFSGNNVHTVTIVSNCEDVLGLTASSFAGSWAALEDYGAGGTFGPYNVTLVQDATNPNKFTFSNFYGSGAQYIAYIVLDIANGSVSFPDQTVGAPTYNKGPLTGSSGTFSLCTEKRTMEISLNFDGGDWLYHFTKN